MKKDKIVYSCQDRIFARHKLEFLIRVIMPAKKDQRIRELKQAAQSCSKLTAFFKKSKLSEGLKELSASESQDIATSTLESEG